MKIYVPVFHQQAGFERTDQVDSGADALPAADDVALLNDAKGLLPVFGRQFQYFSVVSIFCSPPVDGGIINGLSYRAIEKSVRRNK